MKTKIYLLLLAAFMLASCSSENITENTTPLENQLTLKRVETYYPSKEVYENSQSQEASKRIQYFENALIVADSTYNYMHQLESTTVRTYSATAASAIIYNVDHTPIHTTLFTYDGSGRITELSVSSLNTNYRSTMTYAEDNSCTVTNYYDESGESEVWGTFIANEDDLLYARNSPNENEMLIFEDGKPLTYKQAMLDSSILINMEYYDIPVPANRLKTATQVNNITLTSGLIDSVAGNCAYYLKTLEGIYSYSSTFNDLNYVTHSMYYDMTNHGTKEIFYYYNE